MIEDARGNIDYHEEGAGPTLLLVPGSWGTRSAWRGVVAALDGRFRCVTTSLLGYGGTAERRTDGDLSADREAEIVEAVAKRAGGGPVHLAGHSWGGLACLAMALRGRAAIASLALIEPVAFGLLARFGEHALDDDVVAMRDGYIAAFRGGEQEAARRVIDYYGGTGSFDAMPQRMRDFVVATTPANILDWQSGFDPAPSDYAAVAAPTLILRGGDGHPALARVAELLCQSMPKASLATVAGAAHFMMATHPAEVARLIGEHVAKAEPSSG
jgi:pimeloyl-ACP methyl ester carboxylesterase